MTQPTTDNSNKHATPLTEFVGSIFTELNTKWDTADDNHCRGNPYCWKDALIPIFVRLYQIAKTDNTVYWWILQCMSKVDLFKDGNEDIRKSDVFFILSELDAVQSKTILENSGLNHYAVLQTALENEDLASFRTYMPQMKENNVVYDIAKVLKRLKEVRDVYEAALIQTEGDDLGRFFYLVRRYMYYFRHSYNDYKRACDGMMYNILHDVFLTQYHEDKELFCDTMYWIGDLWVRSITLASLWHKAQIPQPVGQLLHELLRDYCEDDYDYLQNDYEDCDTEEQKLSLWNRLGGCLNIEKYTSCAFSESIFKYKRAFPPFSCERVHHEMGGDIPPMRRRRHIKVKGTNTSNLKVNLDNRLDPTAVIPMEELRAVSQPKVVLFDLHEDSDQTSPSTEMSPKNKKHKGLVKAMPFPETLAIAPATPKLFLEVLHSKLVSGGYLANDSVNDFVFIFGGNEADTNENHYAVDWKDNRSTLQAFCSAFYNMELLPSRKRPWAKLSKLFTLVGEPISKLSVDANQVYGKDEEYWMKKRIQEALDVSKKKALESPQE